MSLFSIVYICCGIAYITTNLIMTLFDKNLMEHLSVTNQKFAFINDDDPELGPGIVQNVKKSMLWLLLFLLSILSIFFYGLLWPLSAFMDFKRAITRKKS